MRILLIPDSSSHVTSNIDDLIKDLKPTIGCIALHPYVRHAAESDGSRQSVNIGYSVRTGQVGASHSNLARKNCNRSTALVSSRLEQMVS